MERATLFVQSDVPEVAELTWLLMTVAPMGLLERCHAYKDKKARGLAADAGLFTYPVLMAADILAYDADVVPVGEDQVQHIEVCRDLAGTFNHLYGNDIFRLPKPRLVDGAAKVPGTDGQKMSKSYENTIEVFENLPAQKKKIMRITTDSRAMEEPKDPQQDHLYQLFSLVGSEKEVVEMLDKGQYSIPSVLEDELKINPFLRFDHKDIINAIQKHFNVKTYDEAEIFKYTREWKDHEYD